jgi:hypothetical protein
MPMQVGVEEGLRSKAVRGRGLQYCLYSQEKINLITLLSYLVFVNSTLMLILLDCVGAINWIMTFLNTVKPV